MQFHVIFFPEYLTLLMFGKLCHHILQPLQKLSSQIVVSKFATWEFLFTTLSQYISVWHRHISRNKHHSIYYITNFILTFRCWWRFVSMTLLLFYWLTRIYCYTYTTRFWLHELHKYVGWPDIQKYLFSSECECEVPTAVSIKIVDFWDMMPCSWCTGTNNADGDSMLHQNDGTYPPNMASHSKTYNLQIKLLGLQNSSCGWNSKKTAAYSTKTDFILKSQALHKNKIKLKQQ